MVKAFVSGFTDASTPDDIELSCRFASQWLPKDIADTRHAQLRAALGAPTEEYDTNAIWKLSADRLEDAIALEFSGPKSAKERLDPSWLHFRYRFSWRSPWNEDHERSATRSHLGVSISGARPFFQPHFVFGSTLESPQFREQLVSIEPALPFKLNDGYFKRWVINPKRGNMGRYLKADCDWRSRWVAN